LSFDESYYWIYSRYLDFGFFDHPPMVGLSIFVGTAIFGQSELGVRIVSNLYLLGTILLVWIWYESINKNLFFGY
ncbi:MAG: 4-amino-4-deoxy-L-arabinose transferase, partial [Halobacteriovoraceae bacterium]|nr:4-amino-4-deoxy-L-arabinose transferase [Halobacteriovoraceae bacterium]